MMAAPVAAWLVALAVGPSAAERFLDDLQRAVARGDKPAVAAMFEYPATIITSGARVPVLDRRSLIRLYAVAFPPEMQGVIAMARVPQVGQPPPVYRVALDGEGLTIGSAWIWARRTGGRFRIVRMIVPSNWVVIGNAPAAPPPRRVRLLAGQSSALLSGTLRPFEVQSYVVWAAKGQRLQVKLDGFAGREVVARIIDSKTGSPVDRRAADGARNWSATIEESADYRIDVLRLAPQTRPPPLYVLAVTLR